MKKVIAMGLLGFLGLSGCSASAIKHDFHKHAKKELVWPNTTPVDKSDPYWEFNNNVTVNGTPYKKKEVSPGVWQWVVDEESVAEMQKDADQKRNLFNDLSRRKLSHEEMMNVDLYINVEQMTPFFAVDKYAELYDSLVKQWELQTGRTMEGYRPLSTAKGAYNQAPQEADSKRAVEDMISTLQKMTETKQ